MRLHTIILSALLSCLTGLYPRSIFAQKKELTQLQHEYHTYDQIFKQIDSLLQFDDGDFWNHSLYGPILLIDPKTRIFFANQQDTLGQFHKQGTVYVDTLPTRFNIANTAIDWNGIRWAMVMTPLPDDPVARNQLIIHELFHRIQPEIGFSQPIEQHNEHLDTYWGRVLLRLELEALLTAMISEGTIRKTFLTYAFIYRKTRHSHFDKEKAENALEINEGVAEYTGLMLSRRNASEIEDYFRKAIRRFIRDDTFVRSFAYYTIPIYGYLLAQQKPNWHKNLTDQTSLTPYLIDAFKLTIPSSVSFDSIANQYPDTYQHIIREEKAREQKRMAEVEHYQHIFLEAPTLELPFRNMNISFDYKNLIPIKGLGTVYPVLRITDDWGILTVEKGALIREDWSSVIISEPHYLTEQIIKGEGWQLTLEDPWKILAKNGQYLLIRK